MTIFLREAFLRVSGSMCYDHLLTSSHGDLTSLSNQVLFVFNNNGTCCAGSFQYRKTIKCAAPISLGSELKAKAVQETMKNSKSHDHIHTISAMQTTLKGIPSMVQSVSNPGNRASPAPAQCASVGVKCERVQESEDGASSSPAPKRVKQDGRKSHQVERVMQGMMGIF
jgi:hypothetical protein